MSCLIPLVDSDSSFSSDGSILSCQSSSVVLQFTFTDCSTVFSWFSPIFLQACGVSCGRLLKLDDDDLLDRHLDFRGVARWYRFCNVSVSRWFLVDIANRMLTALHYGMSMKKSLSRTKASVLIVIAGCTLLITLNFVDLASHIPNVPESLVSLLQALPCLPCFSQLFSESDKENSGTRRAVTNGS